MKCLIIAAGKGHRLRSKGDSKPLTPLFDIPLIERVIRCALEAGVDDFFVVTGYKEDGVRVFDPNPNIATGSVFGGAGQ